MFSKDKIILNTILILPTVGLEIKFMFTLQPRCSMLLCIKSVRKSDFFALKFLLNDSCCSPEPSTQLQPFYFPIEKVFGSMPRSHSLNFNTAWAGSLFFKHHTDRIRGFLPPQHPSHSPFKLKGKQLSSSSMWLWDPPPDSQYGAFHIYTLLILCRSFLGSQPRK